MLVTCLLSPPKVFLSAPFLDELTAVARIAIFQEGDPRYAINSEKAKVFAQLAPACHEPSRFNKAEHNWPDRSFGHGAVLIPVRDAHLALVAHRAPHPVPIRCSSSSVHAPSGSAAQPKWPYSQ